MGQLPGPGGLNAGQMLGQPMKALLLFNVEPVLDAADAAAARAALAGSGLVVLPDVGLNETRTGFFFFNTATPTPVSAVAAS